MLYVVGTPTDGRKAEDVTSDSFPLSMAADECVPVSGAELFKQNDKELMACIIKAKQGDAKELLFQSRCLVEIPVNSKEFLSALCLASEGAPLEAL